MNRVLIVRQDKLGDVILSTPVFDAVRNTYPDAEIVLWTQPALEPAVSGNPSIDRVEHTTYKPHWRQYWRSARWLRQQHFDAALLLKPDSAAHTTICRLAGIPKRVGATAKYYGRWLTTNLEANLDGLHEVQRNLLFANAIGARVENPILRVPASDEADAEVKLLLRALAVKSDIFAVHCSTGGTSHVWHEESYAEVLRLVMADTGMIGLVTGSPEDRDRAARIARLAPGSVPVAGETDILTFAALLKHAKLVVCGNTASAHIAAAVGTPVVMFEATPPARERLERWKPWKVDSRLIQSQIVCVGCANWACDYRGSACIDGLSAKAVGRAALELLGTAEQLR